MLDWSAHQLRNWSKINRMMLIQWINDAHQSRCIEPHKWIRIKFDKFHNKVGVENIANGVRCRSNATYQKRSNGMTRVASILLQLIFPINKTYVIQNLNFRLNRVIFFAVTYVPISSSMPDDDVEIATKEKNSIECKCIHFDSTKHLSYVCRTKCSAFSIDRYLCVMSLFPYVDLLGSFTRDLEHTKLPLCYNAIIFFAAFLFVVNWLAYYFLADQLVGRAKILNFKCDLAVQCIAQLSTNINSMEWIQFERPNLYAKLNLCEPYLF